MQKKKETISKSKETTQETGIANKKTGEGKKIAKLKKILSYFWITLKHFFKIFAISLVVIVLAACIYTIFLYKSYASDFKKIKPKSGETQAIFYDKNNEVIYEGFGTSTSERVALEDIPEMVKKATLAAEDLDFYHHGPIDITGILRAGYENYKSNGSSGVAKIYSLFDAEAYSQGGSSITQQLIKNQYLTNDRSFERKIKEIVYAIETEKVKTKDQIFEEYLNGIYYGEQALGIKNAAKKYFQKDLDELSLSEASLLAGLPAAPSVYSPVSGDYEQAKKRQEYVLQQMLLAGFVTEEEARIAANEPLSLKITNDTMDKYPYFNSSIKNELTSILGKQTVETGGIRVYTTLDPQKQELAEAKARENVEKFKNKDVSNAAVVIMDNKNNEILAMVGGIDWELNKVNMAVSARQPGSSFKPIVYTAGFLEGYSGATKLLDLPINFGGNPPYKPKNYDGSYHGNVSVRTALANSLNIPAVEMAQLAGVSDVIKTAKSLGITTIDRDPSEYGLSIALGSAECKLIDMVTAYSAFASNGQRTLASGIKYVNDSQGNLLYKIEKQKKEVIDPKAAYMINNILSDKKARQMIFGSGNKLEIKNHTVAAKTGTTDNYTDSWTIGYTPDITIGVWMGNSDRKKMKVISGIEGAAYIWNGIMTDILKDYPEKNFEKPQDIAEMWVNPYTFSKSSKQGSPNILEYFMSENDLKEKPDFSYLNIFK